MAFISIQNTPTTTGLAGKTFVIPLSSAIHSPLLTDLLSNIFDLSPSDLFNPSPSPTPEYITIPLMIDRTSDLALRAIAAWLTHNPPAAPPKPPSTPPPFSGVRPPSDFSIQDDDDLDCAHPLPAWEQELLDVPYPRLFEIMIAANYLGMEKLSRQAAQMVGERLQGMTARQIRRVLCIQEEELTAEQRAEAEYQRRREEDERERLFEDEAVEAGWGRRQWEGAEFLNYE